MKESIKAIQCHMIKTAQSHKIPGANTGRIRVMEQNCIMRIITFQKYLWAELDPIFQINDSVRDRIKQFIKM